MQPKHFHMLMQNAGERWFQVLEEATKKDITLLYEAFKQRFLTSARSRWAAIEEMKNKTQQPTESVDDYVEAMQRLARQLDKQDSDIVECVVLGLRDNVRNFVKSNEPKTLAEVVRHARLGETLQCDSDGAGTEMLHDTMQAATAELQAATQRLKERRVNSTSQMSTRRTGAWSHPDNGYYEDRGLQADRGHHADRGLRCDRGHRFMRGQRGQSYDRAQTTDRQRWEERTRCWAIMLECRTRKKVGHIAAMCKTKASH